MKLEIDHRAASAIPPTQISPTAPPTTHTQTTTARPWRKRSVSFQVSCAVVVVPSHHDYTEEEYHNSWYDDEEQENFITANVETIRALRHGRVDQSKTHCSRGLEAMIHPEDLERRKLDKASVVDAVLGEQSRQNNLGLYDTDNIGKVSRRYSVASIERAISFAMDDARFVRKEIEAERCLLRTLLFSSKDEEDSIANVSAKARTLPSLRKFI